MRKSTSKFDDDIIGLKGFSESYHKDVDIPQGSISKIRVCNDSDTKSFTGLQFTNDQGITTQVVTNQATGQWTEFVLQPNNMIVGVFAESYRNWYNRLKRFGFIIAKLV